MRVLPIACLALVFTCSALAADATGQAIIAAMRVVELQNYSWRSVSRSSGGGSSAELHGRVTQEGYASIDYGRNTGRLIAEIAGLNGGEARAIFKGNTRCVFETGKGWKTPDELAWGPLAPKPLTTTGDASRKIYLSINYPHEAIQTIVATATKTEATSDSYRGELSQSGARQLAFPHYEKSLLPKDVSGSFVLTFANGQLATIETAIKGKLENPGGGLVAPIDRTTVYELHDIGTTRVVVPADAKKKLDR